MHSSDSRSVEGFASLLSLIDQLLSPQGCAWDRKQTVESVKNYLVDEAYEVVDAIEQANVPEHCKELGDVLFQVLFQAVLREREGAFTIQDVCEQVATKMIRRHPHVFGALKNQAVVDNNELWKQIKEEEDREAGKQRGRFGHIPRSLPALQKAYQLGEKAAQLGFDWPTVQGVQSKVQEEWDELQEALNLQDPQAIVHELGDVLFTVIRLAGKMGINPEDALRKANQRFVSRFSSMEKKVAQAGLIPEKLTLAEWNNYWLEAKREEQESLSLHHS